MPNLSKRLLGLMRDRDLRSRLLYGGIALVTYVGLIVVGFHSDGGTDESALDTLPDLAAWGLVIVWFAAGFVLVAQGNVVISTLACVAAWWLAVHLSGPEYTAQQLAENEPDGQLGHLGLYVLGFINLAFFWGLHAVGYFVPSSDADDV